MAISFSNNSVSFTLKQKKKVKEWIRKVSEKERKHVANISYVFTNDNELLKVNLDFLNHNTYTDIITFDYSESNSISGEIFISIDRVKENAQTLKIEFEEELRRVIIHGILHLCGYKDKSKIDSDLMRKKENQALLLFHKL